MFITTAGWLSFSSQSINNPVNATAQIHTAGAVTESVNLRVNLKLVKRVFDDVVLYFMSLKYIFFNCWGYLNYGL